MIPQRSREARGLKESKTSTKKRPLCLVTSCNLPTLSRFSCHNPHDGGEAEKYEIANRRAGFKFRYFFPIYNNLGKTQSLSMT